MNRTRDGEQGSHREADRERHGGGEMRPHRDDFVDLAVLFHILNQRRKLVVLVFVFTMAMAGLYLLLATPIFEAKSVVELHSRRPRISGENGTFMNEDPASAPIVSDIMNTQFYKMQGQTVRDQVIEELIKNPAMAAWVKEYSRDELDNFLQKAVVFSRATGTYLVEITAESKHPEFAAGVANTFAAIAVDAMKKTAKQVSEAAIVWLREQIQMYEKEVLQNEAKVIVFGEKYNIEGLKSGKATADQALMSINQQLVDYETRETVQGDMVKTLDQVKAVPESAGVLPSTIPRAEIIQQRLKQFTDARSELDLMMEKYTEKHPLVESKRVAVESVRQELEMEIGRGKETAKADLALVKAYVLSIRKDKEEQTKISEEIQQKINRFNTDILPLQRELEASDSSYKGLLNRIEEARLSADEETSLITVYEYAKVPMEPAKPRKILVLVLAFVLGGGGGVGLALLIHVLQDKVSSILDVEMELKQNLIGVIPHADGVAETGVTARICHTDKFNPISEAVASLRAALISQGHKPESGGWAILVVGAAPLEGKTSVSGNLAITMAKTGKRILMIDGDMRRPRLHEVFDVRRRKLSLMEVLLHEQLDLSRFAETLHDTEIENLKIALGHPVEGVSPTEVLDTGRFEKYLDWARTQFDIIVVDSPPLGGMSDGFIYGRMVDDVVLVCRYNKSRKGALKHAINDLQKNHCPVLGVVINDFTAEGFHAHYGYGYGGYYRRHYYSQGQGRSSGEESGQTAKT